MSLYFIEISMHMCHLSEYLQLTSAHICVFQLCMVSLSLFKTLLSLNCEDIMLQLVLRYVYVPQHFLLRLTAACLLLSCHGLM